MSSYDKITLLFPDVNFHNTYVGEKERKKDMRVITKIENAR